LPPRSIVINHLQNRFSSDHEIAIIFAFCRYSDQYSVTDILASFVKQLAQDHLSVFPIIETVYKDHKKKETRPSEQELQELLQRLLNSFKKTYIVIDALDEVPENTRVHLLVVLSSLRGSRASLLLTSRPLQLLEPFLPDAAYIYVENENHGDIEFFINKQIEETLHLASLLKGKQPLRREICTKLKEKSEGMYVFYFIDFQFLLMIIVQVSGSCLAN